MPKRKRPYGGFTPRYSNGNYKRRYTPRRYPYRRYVPRTMGPFRASESKYFDSTRTSTAINAGTAWTGTELDPASLNTLCVPQEGSDINNRIGRKISVYKIALRGIISPTAEMDEIDILASPAIRLILFIDTQTNGVQAQGEELMAAPPTADIGLKFSQFQNLASLGRFRVLRDVTLRPRIVTAGTDGTSTNSQNTSAIPFKMTVKFKKPVVMKFNATNAGSIGDIVDNSFHILGAQSSDTFTYNMRYQCRTYYKDV